MWKDLRCSSKALGCPLACHAGLEPLPSRLFSLIMTQAATDPLAHPSVPHLAMSAPRHSPPLVSVLAETWVSSLHTHHGPFSSCLLGAAPDSRMFPSVFDLTLDLPQLSPLLMDRGGCLGGTWEIG